MSTITRRKRTSRLTLSPDRWHELLTGQIIYSVPEYYGGYGDGFGQDLSAFISDEMKADWENHRDELLAFWRSGKTSYEGVPDNFPHLLYRGSRRTLPWAAKQFDRAKKA